MTIAENTEESYSPLGIEEGSLGTVIYMGVFSASEGASSAFSGRFAGTAMGRRRARVSVTRWHRFTHCPSASMDASQADLVNAGKPETLAGIHGQTHRQTAACMYVIGGETAGCNILICIHYAILIGATAELHIKSLIRQSHRFQPDFESSQPSRSACSL